MSVSLLVLPLSLILLMDCLELGAAFLLVTKFVAVVAIYVAKVLRLHSDAASRDTSGRVEVGAGEVVGVDFRHHPPNVCKVVILSLKMALTDSVVLR